MERKLSEALRSEVQELWNSYLTHPFIREVSDGTLPIEKFRYYMIQDYLYLFDYTKVYAIGIVKANEPELMKFFADFVYSTLNGEMDIHRSYMKRLGIPLEEAEKADMHLDNLSYTHYMMAIAQNGGVLDILAAILSCAWSYEFIGKHLSQIPGVLSHPFFGEWVQGYSCEEYAAGNRKILSFVDRLGESISPAQFDRLKEIFINCSIYEYKFWDMAYAADSTWTRQTAE